MLFKKFSILIIFLTILFTTQPKAWGYNFLYINPTTGAPIGWEPGTTIHYYVDPGPLGRLTNEQARTLIRAAMDVWENASPYADVPTFEYAGLLTEDVTGENYGQYVDLVGCYSDSISLCPTQTQKDLKTVIVFDEQGTILSRELCEIGSCNAYADAGVFSGSASNPGNFVQAFAVFGPLLGRSSTPITAVVATMVHELGHVLGLAHASVNQEIYIHGSTSMARYIPTMFFFSHIRDQGSLKHHAQP
ncbi:MAG: hypothetical protein IPJ69_04985 [Deltaproteobacteria bacterium]|nr:MAG: hypothetical protein IPJ69_04985 [Deltaproteobacteria bacterium]